MQAHFMSACLLPTNMPLVNACHMAKPIISATRKYIVSLVGESEKWQRVCIQRWEKNWESNTGCHLSWVLHSFLHFIL